jgi:hypothetical protein
MKIKNEEEFKKLFELIESNMPLEDEENNQLRNFDEELLELYSDTDSF